MAELTKRYGSIRRLENSLSLYELGNGVARLYIRYSKVRGRQQTFYGLRAEDLQQMEVRRALFARQINRPTFQTSGLTELCTFFEYANVAGWYDRLVKQA